MKFVYGIILKIDGGNRKITGNAFAQNKAMTLIELCTLKNKIR